jgi:radical S-adenosyl methionine domain-containing protein 2
MVLLVMSKGREHRNERALNGSQAPPAVNWHLEATCNYGCKFCYARFSDLQDAPRMTEEEGYLVLVSMAEAGVKKINFVGGEPMLHPHLKSWIIEAKRLGLTTSIVSNGTRMSRVWLEEMKPYLDWLGLSIDASNDALHAMMGRGRRGEIKQGISRHLERCERVLADAKAIGYGIKLNTVVSSVNIDDDMSAFVRRVQPTRWKIFQALPIAGENDGEIESLEVLSVDFDAYVARHKAALADATHIDVVAENNEAMKGTYAMINPMGLAYTNAEGRYKYSSQPVFVIGFGPAWREVSSGWSKEAFEGREGVWDWNASSEEAAPSAVVPTPESAGHREVVA